MSLKYRIHFVLTLMDASKTNKGILKAGWDHSFSYPITCGRGELNSVLIPLPAVWSQSFSSFCHQVLTDPHRTNFLGSRTFGYRGKLPCSAHRDISTNALLCWGKWIPFFVCHPERNKRWKANLPIGALCVSVIYCVHNKKRAIQRASTKN